MSGEGNSVPLERQVVKQLLDYLRSRGAFAEKVHGDGLQPTLLDIIACYKGRFLHLEVKRDGKAQATLRQLHTIRKVQDAGGIAEVVYTVGQVKQLLDDIDEV